MRKIAPLHPEAAKVQAIIAELEKGVTPPVPIPEMRRLAKARNRRLAADPPEIGRVEARTIPNGAHQVPVRLYYPADSGGKQLPAHIYAHGGGFVVGDLDMVETLCRITARDAGIVVCSVDYRLAPEHRFPAGLDDTIAVVRWIMRHGGDIGIDTTRLAIGGDSAGGNLAAATTQALASEGVRPFRFQVLVYPVTDLTCAQPSYTDLGTGYPLTKERMANYIKLYLQSPSEITDVRASPLLARSFAGLPPALVVVAGLDPLLDEGVAYAANLREAGIEAELAEVPDHPHGFLGWSREAKASRDTLALIAQRLRARLHG